ncbi:MAG TPA: Gfo/Idh/MocA family oxidoreductase [Verrucomicrobiota bacterium]|nr:Gfo/Idh/MocA family oxidoreductase [Verrucomicrobiota bacterium]HNU52298.1 Gfo/Idh/MocA family oxidoreductase [Verrucomicrobiota bacterium]
MTAKPRKLRVAVIGCGAVAQYRHLPEYRARDDVELVAVVDRNARRAQAVAGRFGVPHHFDRYRHALDLHLDAVSICTPTAYHAVHSVAFLRAGASVLCEKPMAASSREANTMIAVAAGEQRQLMIAHNQRLHLPHIEGRKILQRGWLGRPIGFSTTFAHAGPETWSVDGRHCHFFRKRQAVWGSLADLGIHKIDLMRWLLEDDFVEVAAMFDTVQKPSCEVEDIAFCVMRTRRGVLGQMFSAWIHKPGCNDSTVVYCDQGILRLEDDAEFSVIAVRDRDGCGDVPIRGLRRGDRAGPQNSGVVDGFLDALQRDQPVPIPATEVLGSLAAVEACIESARTGKAVRVAKG